MQTPIPEVPPKVERADHFMQRMLHWFESVVMRLLVGMMMLTIGIATLELLWMLAEDLLAPPFDLLSMNEMLDLFSFFLIILIGLELLDTVKSYLTEHTIRVEAVFMVAMIAITRKVILLEYKDVAPMTLVGIAALVIALAAGYWLTRARPR
ncbi:MAG TPA: phosphate-starvation-inducible PsiE family protein [Kiritimatiellia bacterium]|nr:phosphate-starvation-inducible PsiE family protein [Kiritimatiellia bacterium]